MDASLDADLEVFFRSYTQLVEGIGRCVGACIGPDCGAGMDLMLERLEFRDRLGFILDFLTAALGRRHPLTQEFRQWRRDLTDVNRRWHATVRLERRIGLVRKDTIRLEVHKEMAAGWVQQLRSISLRQASLDVFQRDLERRRASQGGATSGVHQMLLAEPQAAPEKPMPNAEVQAEFAALTARFVQSGAEG